MVDMGTGILSEHESAKQLNTTSPTGYTPTAQEKKALALVNRLYEKAKQHRKRYDERWVDYYKMFRGKQWTEERPSYRHSEVINMVFQNIQSMVPILTDGRPKIEFIPQEPQDQELASILNEVAESDWQRGNWLQKLTEIIYDAHLYGAGIAGCYEPKEVGGRIEFTAEDPFYIFPDPDATNVNENSVYLIHAEPVDIRKLKRKYPDKAKYIKADLSVLGSGEERKDITESTYRSPVDTGVIMEGSNPSDSKKSDKVLEITLWILDDTYDEEEKKTANADGTEAVEYVQKLRYPKGRKICVAGGVVLDDDHNPYEDGKFPKARLANYLLPREFWGISEVEQLESPQKIFNKLVSFSLDVLTLMGNPIWKVPTGAGIDTDNLINRPGLIVEYEGENAPTREEGVQLQPYVLQLIDRMKTWFDDISGNNDVSRGVRPEGITAASAINSLQEAAKTRARLKSRHIDAFLQDFGQLYASRVFQFYTAPQVFRLTAQNGAEKYFKFHVTDRQDKQGNTYKVAKVRNFTQDPVTSKWNEDLEEKEFQIRGQLDVRVATGSSLPFAKQEKINMAQMLFDRGAIDEVELLDSVDYPNREVVWQRVQERRAQQAAAQQQAQGGGQAPPTQGAPAA